MKITVRNFQNKIPVNPKKVKQAAIKVISAEGKNNSGEITVSFINDRKIRELNFKYLHKNAPTDVLVFDLSSKKASGLTADIIISTDTAIRNAALFNTSPAEEVKLYLVHGVLHLLGYDDKTPAKRRLMRKKEKEYVNS